MLNIILVHPIYIEDHHLSLEAVSSASRLVTDSQLLQAKLQEALPVQLFLGCNVAIKPKDVSHDKTKSMGSHSLIEALWTVAPGTRSQAYKSALLADLNTASKKVQTAKDVAVNALAKQTDFDQPLKDLQLNSVAIWWDCIPVEHIYRDTLWNYYYYIYTHFKPCAKSSKDLTHELNVYKKVSATVNGHLKPKAAAKAKGKAKASPKAAW